MSTHTSSQPSIATTKRLLHELSAFHPSSPSSSSPSNTPRILTHLAPVSDANLLHWRALLLGPPDSPYYTGRWLLEIEIPPDYPFHAPVVKFINTICHPNINFKTGEICLDLLKDKWSAAYTIEKTLESIWGMLIEWTGEGVDSPLNVDLAALLRSGDLVGARGLVRYWTERERYTWPGDDT